jgi:hypothetical protein
MYGGKVIRYTLTWAQRRWFLYACMGFESLVVVDATLNSGRLGGGWGTGLVGLALFGMALAMRFVGVSLTEKHAVVHALPAQRIPWHDVDEVEVEHAFGIKTVVLHHGGGRRTRLNAPTTGPLGRDEAFQEKVGVIRAFWAKHRETGAAAA